MCVVYEVVVFASCGDVVCWLCCVCFMYFALCFTCCHVSCVVLCVFFICCGGLCVIFFFFFLMVSFFVFLYLTVDVEDRSA